MNLSKCCKYQSIITQGENGVLSEKCQTCGYVFSTHTTNIPTPPTSTEVEDFVNDITVTHGVWYTDFERDLVKGITHLIQQEELRGRIDELKAIDRNWLLTRDGELATDSRIKILQAQLEQLGDKP